MALIKWIPVEPKLEFIARRRFFALFSGLLVLGAIGLFLVQGLNFGVDFRGGILMEVRTPGAADIDALRKRLSGLELGEVALQESEGHTWTAHAVYLVVRVLVRRHEVQLNEAHAVPFPRIMSIRAGGFVRQSDPVFVADAHRIGYWMGLGNAIA